MVPGWRLVSCAGVRILVRGDCAPVGVGILTWVLTRMTIILQGGPQVWRCRVIALEEEGPESGVPLDPGKVDVDGEWAGPHWLGLSPSNGWGLEEQVWVSRGAQRKWPPHTQLGPTGQVNTALPANLAWPERIQHSLGAAPPLGQLLSRKGAGRISHPRGLHHCPRLGWPRGKLTGPPATRSLVSSAHLRARES